LSASEFKAITGVVLNHNWTMAQLMELAGIKAQGAISRISSREKNLYSSLNPSAGFAYQINLPLPS
ncbi:MAG: hypothetical protein VW546_01135, partial [Gammaproteobacteria bacterium]